MISDPLEMADAQITELQKTLATKEAELGVAKNKNLLLEDKNKVLEAQLEVYREKFRRALGMLEV